MDGLRDFIDWLFRSTPWWLLVILIPIIRVWWDSQATKRFEKDRIVRKLLAPDADAAERNRVGVANMVTIVATILITLLATAAAYQVDQDVKDSVAKMEQILTPSTGNGLVDTVASIDSRLQLQATELAEFKQPAATKEDVKKLETCTKQWFESQRSRERKVDPACFPDST